MCLRINLGDILNLLHIRLGTVDPTGYLNMSSRLNSNSKKACCTLESLSTCLLYTSPSPRD